jgi:hypothetical protein
MGRSASHYQTKRNQGNTRNVHASRDAQYRAALGIEDAGPLPREIGSVRHQRADTGANLLDD